MMRRFGHAWSDGKENLLLTARVLRLMAFPGQNQSQIPRACSLLCSRLSAGSSRIALKPLLCQLVSAASGDALYFGLAAPPPPRRRPTWTTPSRTALLAVSGTAPTARAGASAVWSKPASSRSRRPYLSPDERLRAIVSRVARICSAAYAATPPRSRPPRSICSPHLAYWEVQTAQPLVVPAPFPEFGVIYPSPRQPHGRRLRRPVPRALRHEAASPGKDGLRRRHSRFLRTPPRLRRRPLRPECRASKAPSPRSSAASVSTTELPGLMAGEFSARVLGHLSAPPGVLARRDRLCSRRPRQHRPPVSRSGSQPLA